jgi:A/G-specific adenine glycosylase
MAALSLTPAQLTRWRKKLDEALKVTRDLPWRNTRDPWFILLAEVMLQQTQAARVIDPYRAMIATFPNPEAMAQAPQADVVRLWAGLGYNSRAVRLHRCAKTIVERFDGIVPSEESALLSLPGIGSYTARAIKVFAFEQDHGVLDTNVSRVLSRLVAGQALTRNQAQLLVDALVTPGRAWIFNQALLDHGATICKSTPDCDSCDLRRSCTWARRGFDQPDPASVSALAPTKQARFAGSNRQLRGSLVSLARDHSLDAASLSKLHGAFGVDRVNAALAALEAEGVVVREKKVWSLA